MRVSEWFRWKGKRLSKGLVKRLFTLGLSRVARALRDKTFSSEEISRQIFFDVVLKGSAALKKHLSVDELNFTKVDGCSHKDARHYYCYGIADEIMKAGVAALHWDELLEGPDPKPSTDQTDQNLTRIVGERVKAEQELWIRKLTEHMINLICLAEDNRDDVFRALIAAQSLDDHLGLDNDFKEFFACSNANNRHSIGWYSQIIAAAQKSGGNIKLPLFAALVDPQNLPKPGRILLSIRERFKCALTHATPEEKIVLRFSYSAGFSESSRSIHAIIQDRPARESISEEIGGRFSEVGLLSVHILWRIYSLCGIKPSGFSKQLLDSLHNHPESISPSVIGKMQQEFFPGDLVLAMGDPAEILRCNKSKYGYTSVRIRYLARSPLPDIVEDEFPVRYIALLVASKNIQEFMMTQVERMPAHLQSDVRAMFSKATHEQFLSSAKGAILDMHKSGALYAFFRKRA